MPSREERFDFDDYAARLKNYAAGKTDDRGYSVADHLLKIDEGSPGVPMPVGQPSELRKATAARRRRQKENYAKTHESESSSGVKPRSNLDEPREHSMRCGGVLCR